MPKTLKLAFAMGGGVSLGAFSGAALTEAIKLTLLRIAEGKMNGTPLEYDKVEIDVFSGASAGSLSLAIMLRALTWRTQVEMTAAEKVLRKDYALLWPTIEANPELKKDLIAAQVAQDLQQAAWVKGIDMKQLLGNDDPRRTDALRHSPGLLDGEAVYQLARRLLIKDMDDAVHDDRRLLSVRCLYACTLTSLTALTADARADFETSQGSLAGLRDALVSRFHKDMRIFDIHFNRALTEPEVISNLKDAAKVAEVASLQNGAEGAEILPATELEAPNLPPRWFRFHAGARIEGVAWPIRDEETWATIAATAIASGAFPAAFPPAILERYSWEYGYRHNDPNYETLNRGSVWPSGLKARGVDKHPFAYVDGGVFNNDPVREAFRLISFIDGDAKPESFLRRLLFVDPSVGPEGETFRLKALNEFGTEDASLMNAGSPNVTKQLPTLPRLTGLISSLVGLILNQGRTREADGMLATRDNFKLRTAFRAGAEKVTSGITDPDLALQLWGQLNQGCKLLVEGWANQLIPSGARSIAGELRRILREEKKNEKLVAKAALYVKDGPMAQGLPGTVADWLFAHLALYFDLALGLEGKRESSRLIAVTPYEDLSTSPPKPLKLLGEPISAFSGFFSIAARDHDFKAGQFCAALFLRADAKPPGAGLLPDDSRFYSKAPAKNSKLKTEYARELKEWAPRLRKRVEQTLKEGLPSLAGPIVMLGLDKQMDALFDDGIDDIIEERFSSVLDGGLDFEQEMEVYILVPPQMPELEIAQKGAGIFDENVRRKYCFGEYRDVLITSVKFKLKGQEAKWEGAAVRDGAHLRIDRGGWNIGYWALATLPKKSQWQSLVSQAHTHLHPVLKLDLTMLGKEGGQKVPEGNAEWMIAEAANPLVTQLLKGPFIDG